MVSLISASALNAQTDLPQHFTLDGRLLEPGSATEPLLDNATVMTIQVLNPAKDCILYEEEQPVNTLGTNGYFSIRVGSNTGATKRTTLDTNNSMNTVFYNRTTAISGKNSGGGVCNYTPSAGEERFFRFFVKPSSSSVAVQLSDDMPINSVPQAIVAQTLQGYSPANFFRTSGSSTQAKLDNLLTTEYNSITDLISGASPLYLPNDPAGTVFQSRTADPVAPAAGQVWYNSSENKFKYYDGASTVDVTAGAGTGTVTSVIAGAGLAGGTITTMGTISIADGGVSTVKIADEAVTTSKLDDASVSTSKLVNASVTEVKLASGSISTSKLVDANVTNAKLATGIDASKITVGTLPAGVVPTGTDDTKLPLLGGTMTGVITMGDETNFAGFDLLNTGHITMNGQKTITIGRYNSTQQTTLVGTLSAVNAGALWFNTSTEKLMFWSGTQEYEISETTGAGGDITAVNTNTGSGLSGGSTSGPVTLAINVDGTSIEIATNTLQIADGGVSTAKLADGSVSTSKLVDASVSTSKLVDASVTEVKLADGSVSTSKLVDGAVTSAKILDDTVVSSKILDGAVGSSKLANDAITTGKILDGTIVDADISATAGIAWSKISKIGASASDIGAVPDTRAISTNAGSGLAGGGDLSANRSLSVSVDGATVEVNGSNALQVKDLGIGTSKLAAASVTEAKLADGSVSTSKLADGAITSAKIADGTITSIDVDTISIGKISSAASEYFSYMPAGTECNSGEVLKWDATNNRWLCDTDAVGVSSHAALTGLNADDHTQYAFLAGRAGGQNFRGGINANNNLTLESTSNAAKGFVLLQPAGGSVGIGTTSPGEALDVVGNIRGTQLCIGTDCRSAWPGSGGGGTVTSVATGSGLTGGPITGTGTISIAAGGVLTSHIADSNITSIKIANDTIVDADINSAAAISWSKINKTGATAADVGAVPMSRTVATNAGSGLSGGGDLSANRALTINVDNTSVEIASNALQVKDGGIATAKLANTSVTDAKLASNAVTTAKILDANVTTAKVADSAITTAKLADNSITSAKIVDGTIVSADIANVSVGKITSAAAEYFSYMPAGTECGANQVLKWDVTNDRWLCGTDIGVAAHSALSGLAADDHTQYVMLAGRAGGQVLQGGTAASNNLTLDSTSNATKGHVLIQPTSGNVGIGTTVPSALLHIDGGAKVGSVSSSASFADHFVVLSDAGTAWEGGQIFANLDGGANTGIKMSSAYSSVDADLRIGQVALNAPNTYTKDFLYMQGSTGNVGIGTINPVEALEVIGNIRGTQLCIGADCRSAWPGSGGGGTVTSVATGSGLTGGPITGSGTISIAAAGVLTSHISDSSVTSLKIANDTIVDADINSAAAISWSKINKTGATAADVGAVPNSRTIATNAGSGLSGGGDLTANRALTINVDNTSVEIAANALQVKDAGISTAKLANTSVTDAKLASNAVTTAKILDANVTTAKLADNSVTSAKIVDGTIVSADIANVSVGKISSAPAEYFSYMPAGTECGANQVLKWDVTNDRWLCGSDVGVTAHSALTGLTADDHTQYVLLAGRAGGQVLQGGTAASNNLTLDSTSNATKGHVLIQPTSGNVGIGTTVPTQKLHVVGNIISTGSIDAGSQFLGLATDTVSTPSFSWTGDVTTGIWRPALSTVAVSTAGVERMRVSATGNVGIGSNNPGQALDVVGNVRGTQLCIAGDCRAAWPSGGTVTSVATGSGLTGGPITATGTISIAAGGVATTHIADGAVTDAKIAGVAVGKVTNAAGNYFIYRPNNVACANGQVLGWDNTNSRWICQAAGGAPTGTAGGDLTGTYPNPTLAANVVTTAEILDGTILPADIAANAVTTVKILDANVTTAKIADNAVTTAKILDANITDAKIAGVAVGKVTNAAGNYFIYRPNNVACANGQVLGWDNTNSRWICQVAGGAPTGTAGGSLAGIYPNPTIAAGVVTTTEILDGTILPADIAANAITTVKILDANVTTAKIADNAVTTAKILNANVTTAKLADNSVTSAKIVDGTIVSADIANVSVGKINSAAAEYFTYMPAGSECASNQVLKWDVTNDRWLCGTDVGVTAHSALTGLGSDDHTQYVMLAGRTGGQIVYGGTAASNSLTLESTSNATKGNVMIQPAGGNVGIGTTSPLRKLSVQGSSVTNAAHRIISVSESSAGNESISLGYDANGALHTTGFIRSNNNLPLIAGTLTTPNALSILDGGNVGIGTTVPAATLDVVGSVRVQAPSVIGVYGSNNVITSYSNYLKGGTGTVVGRIGTDGGAILSGGSGDHFGIRAESDLLLMAGSSERMRILSGGNVGIGTTDPKDSLDIKSGHIFHTGGDLLHQFNGYYDGAFRYAGYGGGSKYTGHIRFSPSTGSMSFEASTAAGTANVAATTQHNMTILSSGRVGVGTTSPDYKFHSVTGGNADYAGFFNNTDSGGNVYVRLAGSSASGVAGAFMNGSVGIGTTVPAAKLQVVGSIGASDWIGAGCESACEVSGGYSIMYPTSVAVSTFGWTTTSDERLKDEIEPLESALDKILQINGVSYNWVDRSVNSRREVGVIAQDVQAVFPEIVHSTKDNFLTVDYARLVAPIIEAIKTLYKRLITVEANQVIQKRELASKADRNSVEAQLKAKDQKIQKLEHENLEMKKRLDRIEKILNSK